jgi:hypothetical protein
MRYNPTQCLSPLDEQRPCPHPAVRVRQYEVCQGRYTFRIRAVPFQENVDYRGFPKPPSVSRHSGRTRYNATRYSVRMDTDNNGDGPSATAAMYPMIRFRHSTDRLIAEASTTVYRQSVDSSDVEPPASSEIRHQHVHNPGSCVTCGGYSCLRGVHASKQSVRNTLVFLKAFTERLVARREEFTRQHIPVSAAAAHESKSVGLSGSH